MRRNVLAILIAAGASGLCGSALADEPGGLKIQLSDSEIYDSNVAQSSAAAAAARGINPEDAISEPQATANVTLPLGLQALFLKGAVGYDFYSRNSTLDGGTVDVQGGFAGRLRNCKATIAGEFNDQRTSLQDLNVALVRNIVETESIRLDGGCGGEIGFGPTLSVVQQWAGNSAPSLLASNFDTTTVTAGIAYRRPAFGELSLIGVYTETDFPNRGLAVGPGTIQDGYRNYSAGVRYDRKLGARIEGTITITYSTLDPNDSAVAGRSGLDYRADISFRVSSRLQTHFILAEGVIPTIVSNSTYTVEGSYSADATYAIGPKLSLKLMANEQQDHYEGAGILPGVDIQRENSGTFSGSLNYQLNRRIAIQLLGSHQVRNADVPIYSFTDDRLGLSISAAI